MVASATGLENTVVVVEDEPFDDEQAEAVAPSTTTATTPAKKRKEDLYRIVPPGSLLINLHIISQAQCSLSPQAYDHAMSQTFVRRVVTGIDAAGRHVITEDGAAPNAIETETVAVSEVLWIDGPLLSMTDSPDKANSGFALEPPPGGASARVIRMPGIPAGADPDTTWLRVAGDDPATPGMHATDTLDLMVVLEGSVVMGLEDGERTIGPGEFVVQRGTLHRWRPADEHGWTYFVAMLRPDVNASADIVNVKQATVGEKPIRRVVTGSSVVDGGAADHRVVTDSAVVDGGAAHGVSSPTTTITDLWHTGGPLQSVEQGGDPDGPWSLVPPAGGLWFRLVELTPAPPSEEGWHFTPTIDVDVVLRGRVLLELPDGVQTELGPGDVVIQRGTNHRWTALGDEQFAMATVMIDATANNA
jgi:quercetin dioxygenase-like cupin family protein